MDRRVDVFYASFEVKVGADGLVVERCASGVIEGGQSSTVELKIGAKEQTLFNSPFGTELQVRFAVPGSNLLQNDAIKGTQTGGTGSVRTPEGRDYLVAWRVRGSGK
ncbi:MAG: hypothetical protein WC841_00460 [Candidatus Shapirobacteria bacterium]|jgi:hypothetical protein